MYYVFYMRECVHFVICIMRDCACVERERGDVSPAFYLLLQVLTKPPFSRKKIKNKNGEGWLQTDRDMDETVGLGSRRVQLN